MEKSPAIARSNCGIAYCNGVDIAVFEDGTIKFTVCIS